MHMNITVDNAVCGLCHAHVVETSQRIIVECEYAEAMRAGLIQRSSIHLPAGELKFTLEVIKRKLWKKFQKEVGKLGTRNKSKGQGF